MLTLLIVEDEAVIRRGLTNLVDWKTHGITVIGAAKDGKEGLSFALEYRPDLIITDIKMPAMSGIEMAAQIRKLLPDCAIIFLSGYDEKDYLISAIRGGINDFIIKSADSGPILNAVLRCRDALLKKRSSLPSIDKLLGGSLKMVEKSFFLSVLTGALEEKEIRSQAKLFDFCLAGPYYVVFLIPERLVFHASKLLMFLTFYLKDRRPILTDWSERGIVGLLNVDSPDTDLQSLFPDFEASLYPEIKLITSPAFDSIAVCSSWFSLLQIMASRVCWFPGPVITASQDLKPPIPDDLFFLLENQLISSWLKKDYADFLGKLDQFHSFAKQALLPIGQYKESLKRTVMTILNTGEDSIQIYEILNQIEHSWEPEEIYQMVSKLFQKEKENIPHNAIVEAALAYIDSHYQENFGLNDLAKHCHASSAYVSKIFKEDIKLGIVEYTHSVRIEKAKELLRNTDMHICDISASVGYSDYKRFSLYFTKMTGQSARAYRRKA